MNEKLISVVAALIRDDEGRVLLVRKRGTAVFMQPGGKREAGESDVAALSREIVEELGCRVTAASAQPLGIFDCASANEPGFQVRAAVFAVDVEGTIQPQAEIEQIAWVHPRNSRSAAGTANARLCAAASAVSRRVVGRGWVIGVGDND